MKLRSHRLLWMDQRGRNINRESSNMAKARTNEGTSKSDMVRAYIARRPNATAGEVVTGLRREQGIDVSYALAAKVKSDAKRESPSASARSKARTTSQPDSSHGTVKRRRRRRRRMAAANGGAATVTVSSGLTVESLIAAKKLADQLGGVGVAKQAVDALARLS